MPLGSPGASPHQTCGLTSGDSGTRRGKWASMTEDEMVLNEATQVVDDEYARAIAKHQPSPEITASPRGKWVPPVRKPRPTREEWAAANTCLEALGMLDGLDLKDAMALIDSTIDKMRELPQISGL